MSWCPQVLTRRALGGLIAPVAAACSQPGSLQGRGRLPAWRCFSGGSNYDRGRALENEIYKGHKDASTVLRRPATVSCTARPTFHNSPELPPPPGHYSHVAVHKGLAYVSGILPVQKETPLALSTGTAEEQARQAITNMLSVLRTVGSSADDILKVTVYITEVEANWPVFNKVYAELMGSAKPARCVVPVPALHYGFACEVECIAVAP
eukprot:TRINITY_DN45557_c0_g1_i1.p1 TRINITY_DN45557_c0_g1~~TRINITY_DN45557_c0_g1_i1.p1  ORF type:complete len:208 (-),score=30.50 TRINITY_DN45557_c0_g1_i1:164-787(-)